MPWDLGIISIIYSLLAALCSKDASSFESRPFGPIVRKLWAIGSLAIRGTGLVLKGTGCGMIVSGSEQMTFLGLYSTLTFLNDLSGVRRHCM